MPIINPIVLSTQEKRCRSSESEESGELEKGGLETLHRDTRRASQESTRTGPVENGEKLLKKALKEASKSSIPFEGIVNPQSTFES